MRKFSYIALSTALLMAVMHLCSCTGGGVIDPTDPITPSPEIKDATVDPISRVITMTKDGITVKVQHWSKARLNRKYTTVDMRSPFYFLETWEQTFQSEVFHVEIINNTSKNVNVLFKETIMEDEREYVYNTVTKIEDFKYRFSSKGLMDLRTKRGLQIAPQIILNHILSGRPIKPGQTVSGFIPFTTPASQATKVWLTLVMEREPEVVTASYEKVSFRFDFIQDLFLLKRQPAVRR